MHILIDECLPKKLKHVNILFSGRKHTVFTVQEKGWSGLENGDLLHIAEKEFDVLLTADRNIEYQQNIINFNIAVVVLVAYRNRLDGLLPLIPQLREVLKVEFQPKQIAYIET